MSKSANVLLVILLLTLPAAPATAESTWVALAAHNPGLEGTVWRTDLGVLNLCPEAATVRLVLRTDEGEHSETFVVPGQAQQIFEDVVAEIVSGDLQGALEIDTDGGVTVTSRTYNLAANGTYGQALDGVNEEDGIAEGESVSLQQLRQDEAFRTNIGVLNMGDEELTVEVALHDRFGWQMGTYRLVVPAGRTVQDNRPYELRFARQDILGGFATVTVVSGSGAWVYASVVDSTTGDPTTVTAKPAADCPLDIGERLAGIEGMTVTEMATAHLGYRFFELHYDQPVDHDAPDGPTFSQYMTLLHTGHDAPMVLATLGYHHRFNDYRFELTRLLDANQLTVEHRFSGDSIPATVDWSLLTIEQAADDHHRIVEQIGPIYPGSWINTGASKGGMTAVYHRRFHTDDVHATVPYVAPITYGVEDARYVDFLESVGTEQCRSDLRTVQREALMRRQEMLPLVADLADAHGFSFSRIGGDERAFESVVVELPFTFWQYSGEGYCSLIPGASASDQQIFDFLDGFSGFFYPSDAFFDLFAHYCYQAHTELGYPALPMDHLLDLLETEPLNLEGGLPPEGVTTTFDPSVMLDVANWVSTEGERLLFIYGENDPYTAAAFELGGATDSYLFTDAGGTHGASIGSLSAGDRQQIYDILERWTGVTPSKMKPAEATPRGRVLPETEVRH